jgi:hypothetical protein
MPVVPRLRQQDLPIQIGDPMDDRKMLGHSVLLQGELRVQSGTAWADAVAHHEHATRAHSVAKTVDCVGRIAAALLPAGRPSRR